MATTGSGKGSVPRRPMRHAVVLCGSVAGLLTARVLADHFECVTLVERDPVAAGGCGGNDGAASRRAPTCTRCSRAASASSRACSRG
jgi:glycine/D-amino acid oxidase-like deaminating enzyme